MGSDRGRLEPVLEMDNSVYGNPFIPSGPYFETMTSAYRSVVSTFITKGSGGYNTTVDGDTALRFPSKPEGNKNASITANTSLYDYHITAKPPLSGQCKFGQYP